MKSFSWRSTARYGHTTLIFVDLNHLKSDFDSDFTIQGHFGAPC